MPRGLSAGLAGADADPSARQDLPVARRRRDWLPFLAVGVAAFLVALVAGMPARFVLGTSPRWAVAGTIWSGEAVLDGAYRLQWRWAPWRSLSNLAFAADVRLDGSGTDIAGSALGTAGGYAFEGLSGRGDGALLGTLAPRLPFVCDAPIQVDLARLVVAGTRSRASGEVRIEPGSCAPRGGGASLAVPALVGQAIDLGDGNTTLALAPVGQGRLRLMAGTIAGGRLRLAPTPAGTRMLPFAAAMTIDEAL